MLLQLFLQPPCPYNRELHPGCVKFLLITTYIRAHVMNTLIISKLGLMFVLRPTVFWQGCEKCLCKTGKIRNTYIILMNKSLHLEHHEGDGLDNNKI
jgi:hypothetical protein